MNYRLLFKLAGLSLVFLFIGNSMQVFSQIPADAGSWKTFIVNTDVQSKLPAPPGKEQTNTEIAQIKSMMAKPDKTTLRQVKYWDAGDPAYRWNEIANGLITFKNFGTFLRAPLAWMNMAIYDANIAAMGIKYEHKRKRPFQIDPSIKPVVNAPITFSYPCEHTVTAAAASIVLAYFFPESADSVLRLAKQAAQSRIYAGVQFPSDVEQGWKLGEQIGQQVIEQAKKDGSDIPWKGTMPTDPKLWQGEYPVGITAMGFKPLLLKTGNQFRPPPPPDFANEMKEIKDFKQTTHSTTLAFYWHSLSGMDYWTELASRKIFEYHLEKNPLACAQIYTLLHIGFHDAAIAIMGAKYAYWGIRPFQYDKTFKPLFETPPFPGYPSGHATASSTAATILAHIFPADAEFFRNKARECADSRFYAGIHFPSDNKTGLEMGKNLGEYFIETWIKKNGPLQTGLSD